METLEKLPPSHSTRSIEGCQRMPSVKKQINLAAATGQKVELSNCQGHGCACKIDSLRTRLVDLQRQYAQAGSNSKDFLWSEINTIRIQLAQYGTH